MLRPASRPDARGHLLTRRAYEHLSEVVQDDLRSLAAEVDPTAPGYASHLNFDQILRRCGHAWIAFLGEIGLDAGVIVPRVEVDYLTEVGLGPLQVSVVVVSLGRTSFRLRMEVRQRDVLAARAEAVLVRFDYGTRAPAPLSDADRAVLVEQLGP